MTTYNWLRRKQWEFYTFPLILTERDRELCEEYISAEHYALGPGIKHAQIVEQVNLERIDTSHRPIIEQ